MNSNIKASSPEVNNNNNIDCEALGCYSKATNRIAVKVGPKGTVFLFLCNGCKPKFCGNNQMQTNGKLEDHLID